MEQARSNRRRRALVQHPPVESCRLCGPLNPRQAGLPVLSLQTAVERRGRRKAATQQLRAGWVARWQNCSKRPGRTAHSENAAGEHNNDR